MNFIISKFTLALLAGLGFCILSLSCERKENKSIMEYPMTSLSLQEVEITGGFWAPIIKTGRENTLPHSFRFCEETGRIENFARAGGLSEGPHQGERYNDTDVYKTIEGASYHLQHQPDASLEAYIDSIITLIASAQEVDGYIFTSRTIDPENNIPGSGNTRWEDVWISHELYNAGHLYEAAVAWHEATGKRNLLDVALKNADLVISVFNEEGLQLAPGHQEIEIGLTKLFRATNEKKYLDQAMFFLNQRGKQVSREPEPEGTRFEIYNEPSYHQSHLPVREQREAVGHAVRAMYMYAGMTDVGYYTGDPELLETVSGLWDDILSSKIYITGGLGASRRGEAFAESFMLPNETAYCETCAAAGALFWNQRMYHLTGDSKYMDALEITLYNGFLSGVSLDGRKFFYPNPLESSGRYQRREWFGVACCPGNVARVIPSLPGYIYSKSGDMLSVNLYVESKASTILSGTQFHIEQNTDYPWDGKVKITISPEKPARCKVQLRIPQWLSGSFLPGQLYTYTDEIGNDVPVSVNGEKIEYVNNGNIIIDREWEKGDVIELEFPMEVRKVRADDRVESDLGKRALVRGPLVYTAEGLDNGGSVMDIVLPGDHTLSSMHVPDLLNGVTVIRGDHFQAIPYYSWANRGTYDMRVWIPVDIPHKTDSYVD